MQLKAFAVLLLAFSAVGVARAADASLIEAAKAAGLSSLLSAVEYTGLEATLENLESGTVLAPTDAAFASLLSAVNLTSIEDLPADAVAGVLAYHVIPGKAVLSKDLKDGATLTPLGPKGAELTVDVSGKTVTFIPSSGISPATVIVPDVKVGDVVVHVIDAVLVPIEIAEGL